MSHRLRRFFHWIETHTPQLKAGFLLLWAITAVLCGGSTLILGLRGKPVFTGILDTFGSVLFFWFFRNLFRYLG